MARCGIDDIDDEIMCNVYDEMMSCKCAYYPDMPRVEIVGKKVCRLKQFNKQGALCSYDICKIGEEPIEILARN